MIDAIQRAYYLEARNPSERDVLIRLADDVGADAARFADDLDDARLRAEHARERDVATALGVRGYPSLVLVVDGEDDARRAGPVPVDFTDPEPMLASIDALRALASSG